MNPDIDWLGLFNAFSLVTFIVLMSVGFVRMFYRLGAFIFTGTPVPRLLKRDLALFGSLALVFGLNVIFNRVLGINIGREPLWAILSSVGVLGALAYWVWVEFRLEDE